MIKHNSKSPLFTQQDGTVYLFSPTALPKASSFLWNKHMMIQMNCRGYATAQFMQPEPAKYAYAPNLEAKTFMQPEQPYYAHHPGRFFYIKDEISGEIFSVPYEPVRADYQDYKFIANQASVNWEIQVQDIAVSLSLSLASDRALELWQISVCNLSKQKRKLSLYPYFPVGYMSWMNQSGTYSKDLQGIICSATTPYQKYPDYFKHKNFKDKTIFLADRKPQAWEVQQEVFEGEGGLHSPSAIHAEQLSNSESSYETPAAVLQYRLDLKPNEESKFRFVFGPAKDAQEIQNIRQEYFVSTNGFDKQVSAYAAYIAQDHACLEIETPDKTFDHFVNHWLPRQVFYHGDVNRLTTDPQTRNFLQDNMGMAYIKPKVTRDAFLLALSQQKIDGSMPDGILISPEAELKYINQIPHTDHCVWLPICLQAYLNETNDYAILDEQVGFADNDSQASVFEHISHALKHLISDCDERGLNYIAQGDWCDPMNMVGYQGKGVSIWLSLAAAYACKIWTDVCRHIDDQSAATYFSEAARNYNKAVNKQAWDGAWYARGITDENRLFGISQNKEGKIFLNPQAWSLLSGAADAEQRKLLIESVSMHLESAYGVELLSPSFTKMHEDIGRVTQKFPGTAENGSVYNHAAAFYIYSLFTIEESDKAFELLRKMLNGASDEDTLQRGQLPIYIPNYYRGASKQFPRTAGRSSQLFNTGTVHWYYRCVVECLFGLKGTAEGLEIQPQIPSSWQQAKATRYFREATFNISIKRAAQFSIVCDGKAIQGSVIKNIQAGKTYEVEVTLPA